MAFSDKLLKEADELCEKCFNQDTGVMLCSGIRLFKREEYPNSPATPGACIKLRQKRDEEFLKAKLANSGIPKRFIETWVDDGDVPIPKQFNFYEWSDESLTYIAWDSGMKWIRSGKSFKYFLTHLLMKKYENWDNLIVDLGDGVDVLWLDNFNVGYVDEYISRAFDELIRYRYNQNLSTYVTVGARKPRNAVEERLYEFMETWEKT